MAAPRKYPAELRERATRMTVEARRDPATAAGAIKRIADRLGVHPGASRMWVKRAEIDGGDRPGTTTADAERIAQLEGENRELRRAPHRQLGDLPAQPHQPGPLALAQHPVATFTRPPIDGHPPTQGALA